MSIVACDILLFDYEAVKLCHCENGIDRCIGLPLCVGKLAVLFEHFRQAIDGDRMALSVLLFEL